MKRREFLIGSALTAGAVRMSGQSPDQVKLDRVSIMSLCFGRILKSTAHPDDANRTIDVLDLADMIAQRWDVHHLEMQHTHFPSTETGYLEEFSKPAEEGQNADEPDQPGIRPTEHFVSGSGATGGDHRPDQEMDRSRHRPGVSPCHDQPGHTGAGGTSICDRYVEDD